MRILFLVIGIAAGALFTLLLAGPRPAVTDTAPAGVVFKVLSGDTVRLLDGRVVRLAWVKAPALDQPGGQASARALDALTLDRRVVLANPQPGPGPAWTATVLVDGDLDVAWLMLKAGYAEHHDHAAQEPADAELYGFAHAEARENRRGLWQRRRPVRPAELRNSHTRACGEYPAPIAWPPAPVPA